MTDRVSRGNAKAPEAKKADGRAGVSQASPETSDKAKAQLEKRLVEAAKHVARMDRALARLTMRFSSPSKKLTDKQLEELKRKVDVGVKLRSSWERTVERCMVQLGMVNTRTRRAADAKAASAESDDLDKLLADFNAA